MQPERVDIINRLKLLNYEHLEKYIFEYCYHEAIRREIILDWNGIFSDWYYINSERIITNLKLFPEKFSSINPCDIMKIKDHEFNEDFNKYKVKVIVHERIINTDYTCHKCKNIGVYIEKKQKRSLDEGKTNVFECSNCKYTWCEN